ncbi:MAG: tetratricopeptide repeat protein, partial [Gemmatales bacterium]|nr:tetratricopeptide repeat protein [Gemmatales bacterium]
RRIKMIEKLLLRFPRKDHYLRDLAQAYAELGEYAEFKEIPETAEYGYRKSILIYQELLSRYPDCKMYREEIAEGLVTLSLFLMRLRDSEVPYPLIHEASDYLGSLGGDCGVIYQRLCQRITTAATNKPALSHQARLFALQKSLGENLIAKYGKTAKLLAVLAQTYLQAARTYREFGYLHAAESHYRQTILLLQELACSAPVNPLTKQFMLRSCVELGELLAEQGRLAEAEAIVDAILWFVTTNLQTDGDHLVAHDRVILLRRLGHLLNLLGKYSLARDVFEMAIELVKSSGTLDSLSGWELARIYHGLGSVFENQGLLHDAEAKYWKAIRIVEALSWPTDANFRIELRHFQAELFLHLGGVCMRLGKLGNALAAYYKATGIWTELVNQEQVSRYLIHSLAKALGNLGVLLRRAGCHTDAEKSYSAALRLYAKLTYTYPHVSQYQHQLAGVCLNYGLLQIAQKNYEKAEYYLRLAVRLEHDLVERYPEVNMYRDRLMKTQQALQLYLIGRRR